MDGIFSIQNLISSLCVCVLISSFDGEENGWTLEKVGKTKTNCVKYSLGYSLILI